MIRRIGLLPVPVLLSALLVACGGGASSGNNFASTGGTGNTAPTVPPLVITTSSLPNGSAGVSYSGTLQASGGSGSYTWAAGTGLPSWMTLDSKTGTLTGTIPIPIPAFLSETYPVSVSVTDTSSPAQSAVKTFYVYANGKLTLTNIPDIGNINVPYYWQPAILGGASPYLITVDSGMPPGLQVGPSAPYALQGTPTQTGNFTAQMRITDSASPPQVVVVPVSLSFDSKFALAKSTLKPGAVGRPYSDQLIAVNGTAPFTWSATSLAAGITLDSATGQFSGTPTEIAFYTVVTVKDSSSPPKTIVPFIPWYIFPAMTFAASPLRGNLNSSFSQQLTQGGIGTTKVVISSGSLPPGMKLLDGGQLYGTPTQTGDYSFIVNFTDADTPPVSIQKAYTFNVYTPLPVLPPQPLPTAVIGRPYAAKLWARDGSFPYTWGISSGQLPPGLNLSADGNITGTPTTLSSSGNPFYFVASVTDSASPPQTATADFFLTVTATSKGRNDSIATATPVSYPGLKASFSPFADPADSTSSAPDTDYYRLIANAGSVVTVSAVASQIDPAMEILDANGQRYKSCKDPGDDHPTLTFIVKDATPDVFDDDCLNDDVDPTVNRNSSLQFQVPGPAGTQVTFYAHVFDASGNARPDMTYSLEVSSNVVPPLSVSGVSAATEFVGISYLLQVQYWASGGTPPYTWQISSGTLPPGLQLVNDPFFGWVIYGTPTTAGNYDLVLRLTDSANPPQIGSAALHITVH